MVRQDRKRRNCPNCGNIVSEKDVELPCIVCGSEFLYEETSSKRSRCSAEKNAQEERVNILENGQSKGHDYSDSSSAGHANPSSGSTMGSSRVDDYQSSSVLKHTSSKGDDLDDNEGQDSPGSSSVWHACPLSSSARGTSRVDDYHCSSSPKHTSIRGYNYHRHDGHPDSSRTKDERHDDHHSRPDRDSHHDCKRDNKPSSSQSGKDFPDKKYQGNQGRSEGCVKSNNRNQNWITNEVNFIGTEVSYNDKFSEVNFVSAEVSHNDEYSDITNSTGTAERDEPFDICSMPKDITSIELSHVTSIELSPVPQTLEIQTPEIHRKIQNLMPGMFLLKKWLTKTDQIELVRICQTLGVGEGGFFQPSFGKGRKMHLWMMCLGKNWNHRKYKYEEIRAHDDAHPPPIPADFVPLVHRAIEAAHNELIKDNNLITQQELYEALPCMDPDVCIVNYYKESGRLGVHQDKDESHESIEKGLPVVSFSIGDSAEFVYGNENKIDKLERIMLESGDVLIFGGKSRLVFHGVSCLEPDTAPDWLTQITGLRPGRLNLTFRQI